MNDIPPITVKLLKEIWKEHNVSDDDTIEFHFCNHKGKKTFDNQFPDMSREVEFEGIYKRPFGILMEFEPSTIEDEDEYEDEYDEDIEEEESNHVI
tara:strand:+ start:3409 stop:3696 length:288 start_codon:yes stop_codon:yes gene_type:complete